MDINYDIASIGAHGRMAENTNYPAGGPPMVRIDGAKARRIREQNGLTQLYVATVVQVTTDTISRWENRRYPTIKKENADKLAEALGVTLEDLLEEETAAASGEAELPTVEPELAVPAPTSPSSPTASRPWLLRLLIGLVLLLSGGWLGWYLFQAAVMNSPEIGAVRILPDHVPPGQSFPVLIRIEAGSEAPFALIVRENLPSGCRILTANPQPTAAAGQEGQLKWVTRLERGMKFFSYLLVSPETATTGRSLSFQGQVLAGGRGEKAIPIAGGAQLEIGRHHWADINGDNRIDDEEILVVYDHFGEVEGFSGLRDEVDTIWAAGGYRWDEASRKYLLEQ
jgi:transcriptional regulator with XRE-family HTH domain